MVITLYNMVTVLYNLVTTLYNMVTVLYNMVTTLYNMVTVLYNMVTTLYNMVTVLYYMVDNLLFFDCSGPFCFLLIEFHCTFPYLLKYYNIMFIIILLCLGSGRPSGLLFFVPALLLSILTPLFLSSSSVYLISFSLFPCASVWENTGARVPYFL